MTQKTVTLYARVSSAEQARPDATSIDQQIERGEAYAKAMDWKVVERVTDDGVSGATSLSDRPQGRLLTTTRSEVIIFWSMDRFTRSASRGLLDIETLEARGVSLVFVKEAIDTSTPSGRLFRTMLAAFAEFEREQIRDRNMSGRFGGAEAGRWSSGQLPFGFQLDDDGDIVIREEEAEVIRKVFALRIEGMSMPKIADHLNTKTPWTPRVRMNRRTGEPIPSRFTAGSVQTYLANEAYAGQPLERNFSASKGAEPRTFYYPVPEVVDPLDWQAAQEPLKGRRPPEGAGEKRAKYALSERIFHRHPETERLVGMYGHRRTEATGVQKYYRCSESRTLGHKERTCPGFGWTPYHQRATSIDADYITGTALLWVIENLGTPAQVVEFLESAERRLTPSISENEARAELAQVNARRERWLGLYADGHLAKDELDLRLSAIKVEVAALERVLTGHAYAVEAREKVAVTLGELLTMKVEETGTDPHAHEDPPRGSSEWRSRLRAAAILAATRQQALSSWAVDEADYLMDALDISVVLDEGEDYKHPDLALEVGNQSIDQHLGGRGPDATL